MTFPESDALKGAISSLRDIVSRTSDSGETSRLLSQIESTISDIESKTKSHQSVVVPPIAVPVSV